MQDETLHCADKMPWCIYCAGERRDPNPSDEHIWPAALGGGACSQDIFRTRHVCRGCNNLAGLWVDGAFYKSAFIQREVGMSALQYLDPNSPGILPPIYMGFDIEIPLAEGLVCERWLGAAGDHIYHVHRRDEDRWVVFAGGDVVYRRRDQGRVYVLFTSDNIYWLRTTLASVTAFFRKAKRRSLTTFVDMETPGFLAPEEHLTSEEAAEVAFIYGRSNQQRHHTPVQIDFADRFLAKLSLGFGHTILGPAVSASPYADKLRKLLWSRDASSRDQFGVKGSGYWDSREPNAAQFVNWPGAWCLVFSALREGFALNVCTPNGKFMTMNIADDPSLWSSDAVAAYFPGLVYVIVPQRSCAFGPIPMLQFMAHKAGSWPAPGLARLEAMRIDPAQLPPKRVGMPAGENP